MRIKFLCFLIAVALFPVAGQPNDNPPLKLIQVIPLPNSPGRFDHFAIDTRGMRVFMAGEGNGTLEIVDLRKKEIIKRIPGFERPHDVYYRPDTNEFLVTDNNGTCKIFRGDTFDLVKTINLTLNYADGVRFDPRTKLLYVANAHKEWAPKFGYLAVIDTKNWKHVGDIKLGGGEIEEVAIESSGYRLFVDINDLRQVDLVDRTKRTQIGIWAIPVKGVPYAIAFDEAHHRLFLGLRRPGTFLVLNSDTGKLVTSLPTKDGIDDIYYDATHRRIYASAGVGSNPEGYIVVFNQLGADRYKSLGTISTGSASATSLFVPKLNRYYVAVQQSGSKGAELQVYKVQP